MGIRVKVSTGQGIVRDRKEENGRVLYLVGFRNSKYRGRECRVWYDSGQCRMIPSLWEKFLGFLKSHVLDPDKVY